MALDIKLLQILLLWVIIIESILAASQVISPDCPETCGNVSIPYPFGTKEGCYFSKNFLITCNETTSPPTPILFDAFEVIDISLEAGELRVYTFVAEDCYNETGYLVNRTRAYTSLPRFPFSTTLNKFTAIGCDTLALIQANGELTTGCVAMCNNISDVRDGSCSGIGCCQIPIPDRLFGYNATVQNASTRNRSDIWSFNPCSYTFLVEANSFKFVSNNLRNFSETVVPTVLNWAVGNQTCEEAQTDLTSYACQGNTTCNPSDNGPGYRCNCSEGYKGNPYLSTADGCQDIDECADQSLNKCKETEYCKNIPGNYTCSCPKGYHGDGRKDGEGCVADQSLVIKVVVGIGVGFIALIVSGSWLYWGLRKRRLIKLKEKFFQQNGGLLLQQELSRRQGHNETAKIFSAEELKMATNNYDETKIIGRGGFGTVYKGILTDDRVIAIKKSKIVDQSQIEQFINEVVVLSQINHRNVVKLLGCCLETEVPLLVYEFVSNGTLFEHIHNKSKASAVSWEIRLRIATETAGVLSYLHSAASTPIIHRDIKPTNILLDDNYTAKVSDFGASRLAPIDQTELSTLVQGTLGYIDPEYFQTSQLTEKSDVYSFGVVLVELLTGKKALSFDRPEEERNLSMYFLSSLKEDRVFQILDDCIVNEGNIEQLKEVANVAKRCLRLKGEDRPTMKEVAMELEGLRLMEKHPWIGIELKSEETEYLLGDPSHNFDPTITSTSSAAYTTTAGYDSMRNHVILSTSDAR